MLCQNCKENEANVKYTQIINGVKKEMNLCEDCARKLGIEELNFNIPISFSSFFGDFLNEYDNSDFIPMLAKPNELQCSQCNMTYDEFMNTGKFGCANCYNTFAERIDPVLNRLHGSTKYMGRKSKISNNILKKAENKGESKETGNNDNLRNLKTQLKIAIKEERYEDAAKLRDEIKKIEEK